jgi:acetyl esterase/lipase
MTSLLRLIGGLLAVGLASLTVLPAPTNFLWKAEIAATEFGYWLVLPALLPLLPGWRRTPAGAIGGLLGLIAAGLFAVPVVRATQVAGALPEQLSAAFGEPAPQPNFADAPRTAPLVLSDLVFAVDSNPVRYEAHDFEEVEGQRLAADVYQPSYPHGPIPAVIVVHGGNWRNGASGELGALNGYLAAREFVVFDVNYRFAPKAPFPAARDDVEAAVAFVKNNAKAFGVDPMRIALLGRSAGAQLALLVAYAAHEPGIRGVISFYGPADLKWGYANPANPRVSASRAILEDYLGGPPDRAGGAYDAASPLTVIDPSTPPTLIIHGLRDELVSPHHADELEQRLKAAGVRHYFLRLPWATHGCDYSFSGPCGQITTYAVERFLRAVMK